jgi:DNA-binding CsgD family transcriptional regulator
MACSPLVRRTITAGCGSNSKEGQTTMALGKVKYAPRPEGILGAETLFGTGGAAVDVKPLRFEKYSTAPFIDEETVSSRDADLSVFEAFLDLRSHCRGPLVALNDRIMVANPTASELLQPADRPRLWAIAQAVPVEGTRASRAVSLTSGVSVVARCRQVVKAGSTVGAVMRFSCPPHPTSRALALVAVDIPGWSDLTNTERALAEVIARGLTNREAGRRIYASRHTVDAHLRNIFRKLGINSRVELARLVGEHYKQLAVRESEAGIGAQVSQRAGDLEYRSA